MARAAAGIASGAAAVGLVLFACGDASTPDDGFFIDPGQSDAGRKDAVSDVVAEPAPDANVDAGPVDRSLRLSAAGAHVVIDAKPEHALEGLQAFTVEMWFKRQSSPVAQNQVLAFRGRGGDPENTNYLLVVQANDDRLLGVWEHTDGGISQAVSSMQTAADTAWHHVALTWDGTRQRIWLDGILGGSADNVTGPGMTQARPTFIGAIDGPGITNSFEGLIDLVRVSKVERYAADFTPATEHDPDADTVLLLDFDDERTPYLDRSPLNASVHAEGGAQIAVGPRKR